MRRRGLLILVLLGSAAHPAPSAAEPAAGGSSFASARRRPAEPAAVERTRSLHQTEGGGSEAAERSAPQPVAAGTRPAASPPVPGGASRGAVAGSCVPVPTPRPVPSDPLPTLEPRGATETTTVDRFTDDYLYSPAGEFKIGTRREWGSTVVFFGRADGSPGINETNTIDANDTGRELQVALYDYERRRQGCAWNASCEEGVVDGCGNEITFLGWNPVQGGNECEQGSAAPSR